MKHWLVVTYKINSTKIVERNLTNQNFKYYLPKITSKKINSEPKEEILFPGYMFIKADLDKFSVLKFTKGIKHIIKFGNNISYMTDKEIENIKTVEKLSKLEPITSKVKIGDEALISGGPFKGTLAKICTLPSQNRVGVLLSFLGSMRRVNVCEKDIII